MGTSKQNALTSSTSIALASLTAVTLVGYTLYSSRNKDSSKSSRPPKKETRDESSSEPETKTKTNQEQVSTRSMLAVPGQINVDASKSPSETSVRRIQTSNTITIAYASTTGTCKGFATSLHFCLEKLLINAKEPITVQLCTVDEFDWWDELLNNENEEDGDDVKEVSLTSSKVAPPVVIFILPTWTNGTLPEQYGSLLTSLDEVCHDWRVAPKPLRNVEEGKKKRAHWNDSKTLQVASFGMGSTAYDSKTFCKPAKDVFKYIMKLGARSLIASQGKSVVGMGDDDAGDCKADFKEWMERVVKRIEEMNALNIQEEPTVSKIKECCKSEADSSGCGCQEEKVQEDEGGCCSTIKEEEESFNDDDEEDWSDEESDYGEEKEPDVMDLEDIGNAMQSSSNTSGKSKVVKEMVTPKQSKALRKEGYRIIGTHSAVKLCRWTKHQLRGRGGCYKHTFYGITSYQCMEATPSLACANKCTFLIYYSTIFIYIITE